MKETAHHEHGVAVLSTDLPTGTLFEEQPDSALPFFGFSPAEPNARGEPPRHGRRPHAKKLPLARSAPLLCSAFTPLTPPCIGKALLWLPPTDCLLIEQFLKR